MTRALLLAHHLGPSAEVVLVEGEHPGLHWGTGFGLPGVTVHASDALAPRRGEPGQAGAGAVAALRGLFMSTGLLVAEGDFLPGDGERQLLRETFASDVALGAALFNDLELAWHTARVERLAVRRARGDALRDEAWVYGLALDESEAREAGAGSVSHYLARWRTGDIALADFVPALLRRAEAHQLDHLPLDAEDAQEPAPGIRMRPVRSPTLPPAAHTNMFLVGGSTAVLIEPATPFEDELDAICEWVEEAEAAGTHVLAICATHHHPDHIGGAVALQERLGLPLWGHAKTAEALEGEVYFDALLEDGQRIELMLDDDGTMLTLECVHTPGHAWGHLCFFEPSSRALIAGDMIAGVGSILVEKHDGDMGLYLESLARMKALGASCLLPAHGGVIVNPEACLNHYVTHRLAREEQVAKALDDAGEGTPVDLVPRAYADTPRMLWPLAARALEAHLIHLHALGRAEDLGDGRYRKTFTTARTP
ncbi:MAG: MBL fold metallo-hydrolase [Sandaracinaceae bacterium]|nr:MBL fold metallo-hydrolase [Sandaracinaceae bacterium]